MTHCITERVRQRWITTAGASRGVSFDAAFPLVWQKPVSRLATGKIGSTEAIASEIQTAIA